MGRIPGVNLQLGDSEAAARQPTEVAASRYLPWIAALIAIVGFALSWIVIHHGRFAVGQMLDTPIYAHYAGMMKRGLVPYRDFTEVYPPLALPVFLLPGLFANQSFAVYTQVFQYMMELCGMLSVGLAAFVLVEQRPQLRRLLAGVALGALMPILMGSVILSRYDLWPTLLTVAALASIWFGATRTGFAFLGLGFAAKAFPIVILPIALIYAWRNQGRRRALESLGLFLLAVLVWFLPFVIASPHGVWWSFTNQSNRPLQIESLGASIWLFAHQVLGTHLHIYFTHGSDNLDSHPSQAFASVMSVIQAAAIIGVWIVFAAGKATRERMLVATTAAVCAFIIFDRVLSPQYQIWLVPLVMMVPGRRGLAAIGLMTLSMLLTQIWFPQHFVQLKHFVPLESWAVIARDLVLVALFGTLAWPDVPIWRAVRSTLGRLTRPAEVGPVPRFDEA
jgi:Glycosyltransferase family 87